MLGRYIHCLPALHGLGQPGGKGVARRQRDHAPLSGREQRRRDLQRANGEKLVANSPLRFCPHCVILYTVKLNTTAGAFLRGSAAQKRVKGKRAQIPHDLVTVIREPAARVRLHRSLGISPGRRWWVLIFQPGNLPAARYGGAQLQITRNWLYRKEPAESMGSFCVAILHAKRPRFLIGVFCCAFPCHATFSTGKEANT